MAPPASAPNGEDSQTGNTKRLLDGKAVRWYQNGRKYSQRELQCDALVLFTGAIASFPAALLLIWHAVEVGKENGRLEGIIVYCVCFIFMFNASLQFHRNAHSEDSEEWGPLLLFLDKMGINCMIAGSYTPICIQSGCYALLAMSWALALFGFLWEVALFKQTLAWKSIVDILRFIAAGWIVMAFVPSIAPYLTTWGTWTILAHGIVYTVGAIFLSCKPLEFHFAIWHSLVLVAAGMFYLVVYNEFALGPPLGPALGQSVDSWKASQ